MDLLTGRVSRVAHHYSIYALRFSFEILFSENADKMHNFTRFAIELNEPEEGVAPTDSRRRPDQRLMEEGRWDDANAVKQRLEELQRHRKSNFEKSHPGGNVA